MAVQKTTGKLSPENGYPELKSPRGPGANSAGLPVFEGKPAVTDSGNPMGQFNKGSGKPYFSQDNKRTDPDSGSPSSNH